MFQVVEKNAHGMPAVEIENPTADQRTFLRCAVLNNSVKDEAYVLSRQAGAFLQCDYDDFVCVEFWKPDYQPFVEWLNENFERYCGMMREMGLLAGGER